MNKKLFKYLFRMGLIKQTFTWLSKIYYYYAT